MRSLALASAVAVMLAACGDEAPAGGGSADAAAPDALATGVDASDAASIPEPPIVPHDFVPLAGALANPERGWMDGSGISLGSDGVTDAYGSIRAAGYTLAYAKVRLDAYRDKPLDATFLATLGAGFARVRAAEIKVVLRFVYNDGPDADAPLDVVLGHIQALAPVLAQNADVIAVMEAGFIGQWGEWHDSTNGLDTPEAHAKILDAILAALPASRMTMLRTPMQKAERFPTPLTKGWGGSAQARIGHHDDCFLASDDDYGTYASPIDTWKQYVADDGRFLFVGGETCHVNPPRSDCASATAEMARLHWTFANQLYEPNVVAAWASQGCKDEIGQELGYRVRIASGAWSERVRPGGVLDLRLHVANDGWAPLLNARPVYVVLDDGASRRTALLADVDPRAWAPGQDVAIEARLRVPIDARPGMARLALWLPDAAPSLQAIPEYAVALANGGVWAAATGDDTLTAAFPIDPQAPGAVDPSAHDFAVIR